MGARATKIKIEGEKTFSPLKFEIPRFGYQRLAEIVMGPFARQLETGCDIDLEYQSVVKAAPLRNRISRRPIWRRRSASGSDVVR